MCSGVRVPQFAVERRCKRHWKVQPILQAQCVDDMFRNLKVNLREDRVTCFNNFRIYVSPFDQLVLKVKHTKSTILYTLQGVSFQ